MDFVYDGKRTHGTDIKGGAMRIIYLGERGGTFGVDELFLLMVLTEGPQKLTGSLGWRWMTGGSSYLHMFR